jgi:hypothetical protein
MARPELYNFAASISIFLLFATSELRLSFLLLYRFVNEIRKHTNNQRWGIDRNAEEV